MSADLNKHILASLNRIETLTVKNADDITELKLELQAQKTNSKWEMRLLSAAWGLIILGIDVIFRKHVS